MKLLAILSALAVLAACGGLSPNALPQGATAESRLHQASGSYGYCQGSNEQNFMAPCPITLAQKNRSESILAEPGYEQAIVTYTSCRHYCYIKNLKNRSHYFKVTHGPKCGTTLVLFRWYAPSGSHPIEATYGEEITNDYCNKG